MKTDIENRKEKKEKIRFFFFTFSLFSFLCGAASAVEPTAPRLFFSDANISFRFPNHWSLQSGFPYGPLFSKPLKDGSVAVISCAISAPLDSRRVSADIPMELLKQVALAGLEERQPGFRKVSNRERELSGHNAYEMTWETRAGTQTHRNMSVYFFVESRVYAITVQATPRAFRWVAPDFQNWLQSVRILSRKESGALDAPAHGGLWIHQTAGVKIAVPEPWLIGVADDRMLGITYAEDPAHASLTVTVDISSPVPTGFGRADRKQAIKSIRRKGLRIVSETEEAFHGYPSLQVQYEGQQDNRVIKGRDIWVLSPKARWLINMEGDVSLYNAIAAPYDQILNGMEFI